MTIAMRVVEVPLSPIPALGVDTAATLTEDDCANFAALGVKFVVRYLPELAESEIAAIFKAGLGLMLVAHVRYPGWKPSAAMGAADAQRVARRAHDLGVPMGATIWCDLEGIAPSEDGYDAKASTVAYEHAWTTGVRTWHFQSGAYIGAGVPLDGTELYKLLLTSAYWGSQSIVPEPVGRGFQMRQLFIMPTGSAKLCGVDVDFDTVQNDHRGGRPTMLIAA